MGVSIFFGKRYLQNAKAMILDERNTDGFEKNERFSFNTQINMQKEQLQCCLFLIETG